MERKLIAAAVSSALALPMAAQAVEFSVSGHVNRAIISVDGGGATGGPEANDGDLQHVDANSSNTRFRFTGSEELDNGSTVGVQLEWAALNGKDATIADTAEGGSKATKASNGSPTIRHANVYLSSAIGKMTLGQGSTATDGMAHARLGGASWLGGVTNWCSYYSGTGGAACASNDGGRSEVLRYDTPAIGPASISVSSGNDDYFDAKLTITGSMGDAGYDFRIGHIAEYGENDNKGDVTTMSAAVSFGQGTSVAAAWSEKDTDKQEEYQYLEVDHSYGDGSIGVYYKTGENGAGTDGSVWGVGIGHGLGGGATAYTGYRRMSEDGMHDADLLFAGMRVTFN